MFHLSLTESAFAKFWNLIKKLVKLVNLTRQYEKAAGICFTFVDGNSKRTIMTETYSKDNI